MTIEKTSLGFLKPDGREKVSRTDEIITENSAVAEREIKRVENLVIGATKGEPGRDGSNVLPTDVAMANRVGDNTSLFWNAMVDEFPPSGVALGEDGKPYVVSGKNDATIHRADDGSYYFIPRTEESGDQQNDPDRRLVRESDLGAAPTPTPGPWLTVTQSTNNNDTSVVQAALNTLAAFGGGEIILPFTGKDWRLGKLTISRNTTFRCMPGVVIKRLGTSYGFTNVAAGTTPLANTADPYSGHGNIKIIGGTWDGNVATEAHSSLGFVLFYFLAARGITIQEVTVRDMVTAHAIDMNGCEDVQIRDCNFLGYKDATVAGDLGYPRTYTEAVQLSQNLDESATGATNMLGTPSRNITVENCVFGPSGTAGTVSWPCGFGNHTASNDTLSHNIKIAGNTFNGQTFAAIAAYTYNDLKITGNRFNGCAFGVKASNLSTGKAWDKAAGTWVTGLGTRKETILLAISRNTFIDTTNTDVSILGTMPDGGGFWATCNDVTVSDNVFKATTATKRSGQNVRLLLCRDSLVSGNQCANGNEGILVDSCPNTGITNNKVTASTSYGIRVVKQLTPPGTDAKYAVANRIIGNHVERSGGTAIGANSVYFATVSENTIIDWSTGSLSGNAILASGSDQGLISGNNIRTTVVGQGAAIYFTAATTNFSVTPNNKIEKPDGAKVVLLSGAGNTYGNLQYV